MFALFLINLVSLAMMILSIAAWHFPPYQFMFPAFLGLIFPALLIFNVLFLFFWIAFLRWRFVAVCVLALLFCSEAIFVYYSVHGKTKEVQEDCFKVLTYNVAGFRWAEGEEARSNPIFDYMQNSDADIICLQEFVINNKKFNPDGIISIDELDDILDAYPYRSVVKLGTVEGAYSFGLACYSKFPILKTKQIPIDSELNGAVQYEIQIKDKTLSLFNIHLESNRLTLDDKELYHDFFRTRNAKIFDQLSNQMQMKLGAAYIKRAQHADLIARWINRQETDGVVVCGDFNDPPISYAYHKIKNAGTILLDSYEQTGFGPGITYYENGFWFRIDYIMHTRNMQAFTSTVDKVKYSDHYPLYSYLRFDH